MQRLKKPFVSFSQLPVPVLHFEEAFVQCSKIMHTVFRLNVPHNFTSPQLLLHQYVGLGLWSARLWQAHPLKSVWSCGAHILGYGLVYGPVFLILCWYKFIVLHYKKLFTQILWLGKKVLNQ